MSTVLTNGIIIPENGSRNWGGDLANNWNILDVNVGYMTDVKNSVTTLENSVTTLENSVAENTANIQINTSNISALQTSKQDALSEQQIANIADVTNKANDSDVVHKSGDETISGVKSFNDLMCIYNNMSNKNSQMDSSTTPANALYSHYMFVDKNDKVCAYMQYSQQKAGTEFIGLFTYDKNRALHGLQVTSNNSVIPLTNNDVSLGTSTNKWKDIYATNATINTSDRNAKQNIAVIDDKLLEAWGNIDPVAFKFKDAVAKKGDSARIHTGFIAQDVKEKLAKHSIDACRYGLFCYNSWDAQEEKSHEEERTNEEGDVETVKVIDTPAREAGETYGLRYIECLVVECAYLRKKNKELENRIAKLEEKFN